MKIKEGAVLVVARRHGGTHLINPLVKRLAGRKAQSVDKLGKLFVPEGKLVLFTRDPRNIITSRFRWKLRQKGWPDRPSTAWDRDMAEKMMRPNIQHHSIPKELWGLAGPRGNLVYWKHWLRQPHHRVTFEQLTQDKRVSKHLAALGQYLDTIESPDHIWADLYKKSHTYSGNFSDWRLWWGPRTIQAFNQNGGPELLTLLGYAE